MFEEVLELAYAGAGVRGGSASGKYGSTEVGQAKAFNSYSALAKLGSGFCLAANLRLNHCAKSSIKQ